MASLRDPFSKTLVKVLVRTCLVVLGLGVWSEKGWGTQTTVNITSAVGTQTITSDTILNINNNGYVNGTPAIDATSSNNPLVTVNYNSGSGSIIGSILLGSNPNSSIVQNQNGYMNGDITMCGPPGGACASGGAQVFRVTALSAGYGNTLIGGSILIDSGAYMVFSKSVNTGLVTVNGILELNTDLVNVPVSFTASSIVVNPLKYLRINAPASLNGPISGMGSIILNNGATFTTDGTIGNGTPAESPLIAILSGGMTVDNNNSVTTQSIDLTGHLTYTSGSITGPITGTGAFNVTKDATYTTNGDIGNGTPSQSPAITVNGTMNVSNSNSVTASAISLASTGQLFYNSGTIIGPIDGATAVAGAFTIGDGTHTVAITNSVGATNGLSTISVLANGTWTVASGFDVSTLNISGVVNGNGNNIGPKTPTRQMRVNTSGAGSITGNINLGTNANSSLTHNSTGTITGSILMHDVNQTLTVGGTQHTPGSIIGAITGPGQAIFQNITSFYNGGTPSYTLANNMGQGTGLALSNITFDTVGASLHPMNVMGALTSTGSVSNPALNGIDVLSSYIIFSGGSVTVTGVGNNGLSINNSTVANSETMTVSGSVYGVKLGSNATLTNNGTLSGTGTGSGAGGISLLLSTLINNGTLSGTGTGSVAEGIIMGQQSTFTNNGGGTVTATGTEYGLTMFGSSSFINNGTLTASGGRAGINVYDSSTVTNNTGGRINATGGFLVSSGATVANGGTLTVSGGAQVSGSGSTLTNNAGGTINATGGFTAASGTTVTNGGTINVLTGDFTVNGTYTVVINGNTNPPTAGVVNVTAGNLNLSGGTLTIQQSGVIPSGTNIPLFTVPTGDTVIFPAGSFSNNGANNVTASNGILTYAVTTDSTNGQNNVNLTIPIVAQGVGVSNFVAQVLTGQVKNSMMSDADLAHLQALKGGAAALDNAFVQSAGSQVPAQASAGGSTVTSAEASSDSTGFLDFGTTYAEGGSATAAGSVIHGEPGLKVWGKVYSAREEQSRIQTYEGYVGQTYGWVGALTATVHEGLKWGVSLNTGRTQVTEKRDWISGTLTTMGSLSLYGFYSPHDTWFMEGVVGAGGSKHKGKRLDPWGALYVSRYGDSTYSTNGKVGRVFKLQEGIEAKPFLSLMGSMTHTQGHGEDYLDGWEMYTRSNTTQTLQVGGGLNLKVQREINEDWRAITQVTGTYLHEVYSRSPYMSVVWVGAPLVLQGPSFGKEMMTLGAGIELRSRSGFAIALDGAATMKNKFVTYLGSVRVAYKFKKEQLPTLGTLKPLTTTVSLPMMTLGTGSVNTMH